MKYQVVTNADYAGRSRSGLYEASLVGMSHAMEMFMSGEKQREIFFGSSETEKAYRNGFDQATKMIQERLSNPSNTIEEK